MCNGEILEYFRKKTEEDFYYFSNKNKSERELYVVRLFLSFIGAHFEESELETLEQKSKTDVRFKECCFQVKELMNKDFKRGDYYKKAWKSAENAKTMSDLLLASESYDVPTPSRMIDLVFEEAERLSKDERYLEEKEKLDLLFYITRTRASLIQEDEIQPHNFLKLGWRSVLCVNEKQAVILFSSDSSPSIIQTYSKRISWSCEAS